MCIKQATFVLALFVVETGRKNLNESMGDDIQNTNFKHDCSEVSVGADTPVYRMSGQSKSCDTSTQQRNLAKHLPLPFRHYFGTRPT